MKLPNEIKQLELWFAQYDSFLLSDIYFIISRDKLAKQDFAYIFGYTHCWDELKRIPVSSNSYHDQVCEISASPKRI